MAKMCLTGAMARGLPLALALALALVPVVLAQGPDKTNILQSKEELVERLAEAATRAYTSRCNATCTCSLSACSSRKSTGTTECSVLYGSTEVQDGGCSYQCSLRKLDYSVSNILTSERNDVGQELCWTGAIDAEFVRNHQQDMASRDELRWQYFSSNSGLTRLYPAHTLRVCHVLNPLIRPWYVAATSGPKNVILILDTSASMLNYGRLPLALKAAATVIETLTNVDYATVVLFSDTAEQLLVPDQHPGTLLRASYANISALSRAVGEVSGNPAGGTNFEAAFMKAFDILDLNSGGPNSANCSTALLFLTDGFPNKGSTSQDILINLVHQRNSLHDAIVFTYTLGGSNSGAALARGIACETSGVYTQISDGAQLRDQLSLYYDYFALLRQTNNVRVSWVEPYVDTVGAGLLVTASKAIYDSQDTPPKLIGVVGVDVLVSDLRRAFEEVGLEYQDVINFLASQNVCPNITRFNESVLDVIRTQRGGEPCGGGGGVAPLPAPTVLRTSCSSMPTADYCGNYEYRRYESDVDLYRDESCCFNGSGHITVSSCGGGGNAASSVHTPAVTGMFLATATATVAAMLPSLLHSGGVKYLPVAVASMASLSVLSW